MLLLPAMGAFATTYSSTFNIEVVDADNAPVNGAKVYLWDINNSYNGTNGLTGDSDPTGEQPGFAKLTMPAVTESTDSTSNPSPNIGILVLPPAGSTLTFNTSKVLFYNFFANGAIAPAVKIQLEEGAQVRITPKHENDADTTNALADGWATGMTVRVPGVPENVFAWRSTEIMAAMGTNPYWDIYWPADKPGFGYFNNDSNEWNFSTPVYFDFQNFSFNAGTAGMLTEVELVQMPKMKGAFKVVEDLGGTTIDTGAWRDLHYGWNDTISNFQPEQVYWFPVGTYNFNYALNNHIVGTGFGAAKGIWNNVEITPEDTAENPEIRTFVVNGGTGLTVNIILGETEGTGDPTALAYTRVDVEKLVDFGGYQHWVGYESTPGYVTVPTTGADASGMLYHRLSQGRYRIRLFDNSYNAGVVDSNQKCFAYVTSEEFEVADNSLQVMTKTLNMPQKPGFLATVDANFANGYAYSTNNPIRVAYMPEPGSEFGYEITNQLYDSYDSNGVVIDDTSDPTLKHIFIPFVQPGQIVVMANLGDPNNVMAPLFKVFPPFAIDPAGGTQSPENAYVIDDSNFVAYSGTVKMQGSDSLYQGKATIKVAPVITSPVDPVLRLPAANVFTSAYTSWSHPAHLEWDNTETSFEFAVEMNRPYVVDVVPPQYGELPLQAFVPYHEIINTSAALNQDIILQMGGMFNGQIQVNGENQAATVRVAVTRIFDENDFNQSYEPPRVGMTNTDGSFTVSGLKTGRYNVRLNINGPDISDVYSINYQQQTMPIFNHEVFVDAGNLITEPINFNYNSAEIGYASGKITDELGNPLEGIKVAFTPKEDQVMPEYYEPGMPNHGEWFDSAKAVFFCVTNANGELTKPGTEYQTLIPLPAGEYNMWANGILVQPTGFTYDMGYFYVYNDVPHYEGKTIGGVQIYAGQVSPMPDSIVERRFALTGVIRENINQSNNPVPYLNFSVVNDMGEYVGWGYTNENGEYTIDSLKPGMVKFGMMLDGEAGRRFYLPSVNFDPQVATNIDVNLDPSTLTQVTINTVDGDDNPLPWAGGSIVMSTDPTLQQYGYFHLTWADSGENGTIEIKLPDISSVPELAGFNYRFEPAPYYYEADGQQTQLYAPEPMILDLTQTAPHVAKWVNGATLDVVVSNPTQVLADRTIGILLPFDNFFQPVSNDPMDGMYPTHTTGMPMISQEEFAKNPFGYISDGARLALMVNGKFTFKDLQPGNTYAFISYEMSQPLPFDEINKIGDTKEEYVNNIPVKTLNGPNVVLFFRNFGAPIFIDANQQTFNTTFAPVGNLTVDSLPDPLTIETAKDVRIGFGTEKGMTSGMFTWPAVFIANAETDAAFPVKLPAERAYQIAYTPKTGEPYLAKVDENVFLPAAGKTHVMNLKKVNKISGTVTRDSMPVNGAIVLVPEGADVFAPEFQPIRIPILAGLYKGGLSAGTFFGYVVPATGAPKYISVQMGEVDQTLDVQLTAGVKISGQVVEKVGETFAPVPGAAVNVMRKRNAVSDLADGSPFYPYPAQFNNSEVYCAPDGTFSFEAEPNVNYYLQGMSPMGYRPGLPKQVVVAATDVTGVNIELKMGMAITGTLSGPAVIEARPSFVDPLQSQISETEVIRTPAFWADPNDNTKYPFSVEGLDPNKPYDLTIIPSPLPDGTALAMKKVTSVIPGTFLGHVEFAPGFKLYGQLVDAAGNPLKTAGVPVNLAMTLSMDMFAPPDGFELPDGFDPTQLPDGFVPPDGFDPTQLPDGFDPTQYPDGYDPTQYPDGFDPTQYPDGYDPTNPPPMPTNIKVAPSQRMGVRINTTDPIPDPTTMPSLNQLAYEGLWTQTDAEGKFVFEAVPGFMDAFLKTEQGFSYNGVDYGRARTEPFASPFTTEVKEYQMNIVVPIGGKIIGRLIDELGQPIKSGVVEAFFGEFWAEAKPDADGKFVLSGLVPAPAYMFNVREVPGRAQLFRANISVEPGKITDLGALPVAKAIRIKGLLKNVALALQYFFFYGYTDDSGMSLIAFDGNKTVSDLQLLNRSYMQDIVGEQQIFWDPTDSTSTDIPFEMFTRAGKTRLGVVIHREGESGEQTMITWGWKPGLSLPTQEQLDADNKDVFDLTGNPVLNKDAFGFISGTLKHAVNTEEEYYPKDAVIALYPVKLVEGSTTEYELVNVPFPTAVTNPVGGMYFIEGVPQGTYRIKVVSRKYGTQFFKKIITIGTDPVMEELVLGASVKQISGVVNDSNGNPVANAAVKLILKNLTTATDAEGKFSFYLPLNDFLVPQLEIKKVGYATLRALDVPANAELTSGFIVTDLVELGTYQIAEAAGVAEVTVTDKDSGAPMIGAEVTMIVEKSTSIDSTDFTIFTPADVQFADENGVVRFASVPVSEKVRFRARNFYYTPITVEVAETTGSDQVSIQMQKAPPKVFYTGQVTKVDGSETELQLKAQFDFNQVVERAKMGFNFNNTDYPDVTVSKFTYPDLLGGRLTNFAFADTFTKPTVEGTPVNAVVAYNSSTIGTFDVMAGLKFRKEFEVDPLAESGFAGRMTDDSGNQLPVGLFVPPGYLPPDINSFELKVEEKPTTPPDGVEGATFAGPTFEFTFNDSSFGAGTDQQNGLFTVTLEYEPGTKLEPRWQDTNGNWSKVGIDESSIKWDSPSAGYVTFNVSHLTKFSVLGNVAVSAQGHVCDFNGDGVTSLADIAIALAFYLNPTKTAAELTTIANGYYSGVNAEKPVTVIPNATLDDINGDGFFSLDDIAALLAWYLDTAKADAGKIAEAAKGFYANFSGTINTFPQEVISR
jgi:hypothetical protein